ncbi:MAG: MarR family EPS-associated transcriptional regulator [Rhodovulum sp.]
MTKDLQDDIHFRVLRILEQRPDISQRELAREVGVALGKVNFLLNALAEKGLIKVRNFRAASNKRKYAYILTPAGLSTKAELATGFLRRKMVEYDALRAEIESLQDELEQVRETAPPPLGKGR